MRTRTPRVVIVTRPTELERVIARHGTRAQAAFFMRTYGQDIDLVQARHDTFSRALDAVLSSVPVDWRHTRVTRDQLDRFLFAPEDIIVAVGQDGLVANIAKYTSGQPVIGVNPDPGEHAGVLARHAPDAAETLLRATADERARLQARCMVEARLGAGLVLRALNEIFIGHISHQAARYQLGFQERTERQISSGVIVSTGTGATGWARSILLQRRAAIEPPTPCEPRLLFLVREAYPSPSSSVDTVQGTLSKRESLQLVSQMNHGGVVFGDGIEEDRLTFPFGMSLSVGLAEQMLQLVTGT